MKGKHLDCLQEIIEFHRKRGNSENFIREEKYNYDLKHFPWSDRQVYTLQGMDLDPLKGIGFLKVGSLDYETIIHECRLKICPSHPPFFQPGNHLGA